MCIRDRGENVDWMVNHGVEFGEIDNYQGMGKFDCFHWFEEGSGSNYIDPMLESAQKLGAVVMADTPALDLVVENGAVKGLYAEKPDGSILQVNAKAVILTSGGYAQNEETMAERGWDLTYSHNNGVNGHDGDGLRMATSAGAHDVSRERCFLREAYSFGIDFFADMSPVSYTHLLVGIHQFRADGGHRHARPAVDGHVQDAASGQKPDAGRADDLSRFDDDLARLRFLARFADVRPRLRRMRERHVASRLAVAGYHTDYLVLHHGVGVVGHGRCV